MGHFFGKEGFFWKWGIFLKKGHFWKMQHFFESRAFFGKWDIFWKRSIFFNKKTGKILKMGHQLKIWCARHMRVKYALSARESSTGIRASFRNDACASNARGYAWFSGGPNMEEPNYFCSASFAAIFTVHWASFEGSPMPELQKNLLKPSDTENSWKPPN